jgi:hypothetical protein
MYNFSKVWQFYKLPDPSNELTCIATWPKYTIFGWGCHMELLPEDYSICHLNWHCSAYNIFSVYIYIFIFCACSCTRIHKVLTIIYSFMFKTLQLQRFIKCLIITRYDLKFIGICHQLINLFWAFLIWHL